MMELPGAFDRLRGERMWVAWADEEGRKVPKSPHGGNARSNDPSTWGTYEEALASASRNGYSGVGLMLTDGYIGIDLDGAVENGEIADWAQDIVRYFGSYTELSPSGSGLHVIAWADPEYVGPVGRADRSAGIEIYNHGRYFTVTGESVNSAPIVDATQDVLPFIERYFHGESPEEAVRRRVGNLARDQVKRRANRTMAENCARDGVRYARVPVGAETCGFCIMLASRGFVYTTPEAAAHAHDGCDCKVMPGFPGMEIDGYDPEKLYRVWRRIDDAKIIDERLYHGHVKSVIADAKRLEKEYGASWTDFKRTGDFDATVNAYLGSIQGPGSLSAEPGDKLWGKEIQLGSWFSSRGHNVQFKKPSSLKGDHTADMYIDGELWEAKRVTSSSRKKLRRRVSEASEQSSSIIIDLSANDSFGMDDAKAILADMLDDEAIERIMIVSDGKAEIMTK